MNRIGQYNTHANLYDNYPHLYLFNKFLTIISNFYGYPSYLDSITIVNDVIY